MLTLADYVSAGIMTMSQRIAIERAVCGRQNILVVGGIAAGKTTLTNAILQFMAKASPTHRIILIEDTPELRCGINNHVALRTSYTVDQLQLLRVAMRLRPDRVCLGEARGAEAFALLKAWNTGHPGGVCTIHANHARDGLIRMEQLIAEATPAPMGTLIGEAVDLIVSIGKTGAKRRVKEVLAVRGYKNGEYLLADAVTGTIEASEDVSPVVQLINQMLRENSDTL